MRITKYFICVLLIFAVLLGFVPQLTLTTDAAAVQKLWLHAFYPAQVTFSDSMKKYIDSLDSVSFAWGRIYSDLSQGVVTELGRNGNTMFYYPTDYVDVLKYAKSKNEPVQLNIFTDSVNAAGIFPYKEQRDKAVNAIVELLKSDVSNGQEIYFDGVVIDAESLSNKDLKGNTVTINGQTISSWYVQFLKELKTQLKANKKSLYVAVNPLLNFSGYDYKGISAVADKMIVMAHDYEPVTKLTKAQAMQYPGYNWLNPVDSLAPVKKVKLAMEDVKKYVDKANLSKVVLQLNFDAAQWRFSVPTAAAWNKTSGSAISMEARNTPTYSMLYDRIHGVNGKVSTNMTYSYNNELQSPVLQFFNVADNSYNIAVYENNRSIKAKMDLVREYGLGGISLWSLANVPDYNDQISKKYGLNVWDTIITGLASYTPAAVGTKVTFTDKVIETAVRKQLMKPSGTIYSNELSRVYKLSVPVGVKTLIDLKKLTNLEFLDLANTKISSIAYLSYLKNLRVLYLQRNSISDITPLKSLTKLEVLSLNGNRVSSISSLSVLTSLTELYIMENRITDYSPLLNLKKLNILYLGGNKSTNYTKLSSFKKGLLESDIK